MIFSIPTTGIANVPGCLYIVATPIGHLEDITFRAVRILKEADVIACEDTRHALKLLNAYGIKKPLISYYQPKERQRLGLLLEKLLRGQTVALISDSGTPGISDPGFRLVREALGAGIRVVPVPGPAAVAAALCASGLSTHRFLFLGFPPPKQTAARKKIASLRAEEGTLVFYVPVRKAVEFLTLVHLELGNRNVVIAREMTKLHEEFLKGKITDVMKALENRVLKGEATILVEGKGK
jgi:16S rRNA (cytidine1402-2'-O)-methyltransferase